MTSPDLSNMTVTELSQIAENAAFVERYSSLPPIEQLLLKFVDTVERQAFLIPPPNPHTPLLIMAAIYVRDQYRQIKNDELRADVLMETKP